VAAIVGAEDAGRMGLFWLVMEVWVCLVTGNKKIFVLGLTPHLLTCFFLITCSFIIGPIVHIVGIAYSAIAADMLPLFPNLQKRHWLHS
jgi:hypothetical protein